MIRQESRTKQGNGQKSRAFAGGLTAVEIPAPDGKRGGATRNTSPRYSPPVPVPDKGPVNFSHVPVPDSTPAIFPLDYLGGF